MKKNYFCGLNEMKTPMENERNIDKLANYIIKLGALAAIIAICYIFTLFIISV